MEGAGNSGQSRASVSFLITGKNYEFRDDTDTNVWYKGTFSLREDTTPRQYIALISECPFPQYVGKTALAIYQIEGGTLTITGNEPGKLARRWRSTPLTLLAWNSKENSGARPPNRVGGRNNLPPPTPPSMRVRVRRSLAVLTDKQPLFLCHDDRCPESACRLHHTGTKPPMVASVVPSVRRLIRFDLRLPSHGASRFRSCFGLMFGPSCPSCMRDPTAVFTHRGLPGLAEAFSEGRSPHQFAPMSGAPKDHCTELPPSVAVWMRRISRTLHSLATPVPGGSR